jgi:hypothetical protein
MEVNAGGGASIASSCADFLQQMGYREYSRYLSFHFPFLHERALLGHLRACPWKLDQLAFKVRNSQPCPLCVSLMFRW